MTPYYDQDGIVIYHGDCREMVSVQADATVTDPPYGTGYYQTDRAVLTPEFIASLPRPIAMFGWPENLIAMSIECGMTPDEWVTWWPANGKGRGFVRVGLWREVECIAVFGQGAWDRLRQPHKVSTTPYPDSGLRGAPHPDGRRMGDVWTDDSPNLNPNQPRRLHPNEKPLSVMRRLVMAVSEPGATVFDPFMGSGTTVVAARDAGRKAIGIEIEERYCEVAAKRLAQGVLFREAM